MTSIKQPVLPGLFVLASLTVAAFGFSASARADVYDFSYVDAATNGQQVTASGTITTGASEGNGYFDVTAITGMRNKSAITGLLPVNAYAGNDNWFSPTQTPTYLDLPGVSFSAADGFDYNLSADGTPANGYVDDSSQTDPAGYAQTEVNLTISAVPEPASMALLGVSLFGLGVIRRRQSTKTSTAC